MDDCISIYQQVHRIAQTNIHISHLQKDQLKLNYFFRSIKVGHDKKMKKNHHSVGGVVEVHFTSTKINNEPPSFYKNFGKININK